MRRRQFIKATAGFGMGVVLTTRNILGGAAKPPPSDRLDIAIVGVGGRGRANTNSVRSENITALCDVNDRNLAAAAKRFPKAKTYHDWRKMYDDARAFDAVVCSTTDHTHAFVSIWAMKLGKHVYCEKPLAHSVYEARMVRKTYLEAKVATQMGTQIHAGANFRRVVELVQSGAIGPVREGTSGSAQRLSGRITSRTCRAA